MRRSSSTALLLVALALALVSACTAIETAVSDPQPATWGIAPGQEIGPETTSFVALVTERECASGRSSEGRVVGPEIAATADAVVVSFAVRPLGGAQECPGNPATPVEVRLDEPLGERRLLDGHRDPPAEPPVCQGAEFCE
jgi:hypothetical protein